MTLNAGFRMPSWFDLRTLDATAPEDEEGIMRATSLVHNLINDEVKVVVYNYYMSKRQHRFINILLVLLKILSESL